MTSDVFLPVLPDHSNEDKLYQEALHLIFRDDLPTILQARVWERKAYGFSNNYKVLDNIC